MMKNRASAMLLGALLTMAGGVFAAEMETARAPMKAGSQKVAADKDGMVSVGQMMDMERARIADKMRAMGIKGDKMTQSEWEKMREELYRGI